MAHKNRKDNREAAKAANEEQKEFLDEMTDEDFNPDQDGEDEGEDEGENQENATDTGTEKVASEAEEAAKVSDPNVKTGKEEGKEASQVDLFDETDDDDGEVGDEAKKPEAKTAESEKKEEVKPEDLVPEPKPEKTEAEKAEEERLAAEEAKKAPEPETEPVKPVSDAEAAELFTQWRTETENLLATHHYALTQEQVDEYEENPAQLIPKLMSKVYMDSISAAFNQFTNYLPRMVGMVIEQRDSMNQAEKSFFDKWPDLLNHRDTVLRLGMAYRQSNPQASMEDFVNEVGAQTMVALRLNPANVNGVQPNANAAPPASPPAFKPAVNTPAAAPAPKKSTNVFEQLAEDFDTFEEEIDTN